MFYLNAMEEFSLSNEFGKICKEIGISEETLKCLLMIKAIQAGEKIDEDMFAAVYESPVKAYKNISNVSTDISLPSYDESAKENYFLNSNTKLNSEEMIGFDTPISNKEKSTYSVRKTLKKIKKGKDGVKHTAM